jgi:S-formylglutathione hydrolase FrmB
MLLRKNFRNYRTKFYPRKFWLIIASLVFIIYSLSFEAFGQGTVVNKTFYSNSLEKNRNVQIYLPQGYNQSDSTIRYPVIYFLHGATLNQTSYGEMFDLLNTLIAVHFISPIIIVKPDGSAGPYAGSYYTNSELYGDFEDYIVFDLVAFIDSAYNTIPSRGKRAIMGHSMGAYGAMKLALKHPDVYCSVSAHSGPLDFKNFSLWFPRILLENGGAPVSSYQPAGSFTLFFYSMAGAFSPNLNHSPEPVDFPLDSLGNWIDSVWNRWSVHDPAFLARNITEGSDLTIFFDCGIYDEYNLYPFNVAFADSLYKLGLPYVFQSYNGNHSNQLLNRFNTAFRFLDTIMNRTVRVSDNYVIQPESFSLLQNYPNPFNPTTKINWRSPVSSRQTLKVYDVLGNEVVTLVDEYKPAGSYEVDFKASNLPSGVYFYQLKAGKYVETKKAILMR